ncbi:MAG: hypothetical protein SCJ94_10655 [Bacillota bacterium]|nr:hypothetical protein [Bacillota bacterium]MDW7730445.1 hypothetical protein [Bacillota bacterium]
MRVNEGKTISVQAVCESTGRSWDEWFTVLNKEKAEELSHNDIFQLLNDVYNVPGWWAQSITVEYERHIGRRKVGQISDGYFHVSKSKTLNGDIDRVFTAWQNYVHDNQEFNGIAFSSEPRESITGKWRYWRVNLSDGSRVVVSVGIKTDTKSTLTITSEKLAEEEAIERWKGYWKEYLHGLS